MQELDNKTKPYIPLTGAESEYCAWIKDKVLDEIPGVWTHRVELNNHRAVITADCQDTWIQAVNRIRDLGYGP